MQRGVLLAALFLAGGLPSAFAADTITKIGMIDVERIATAYFRESKAYRDYQAQRIQAGREADLILEQIQGLENQRLEAERQGERQGEREGEREGERQGERQRALSLSEEVFNLREYHREFVRIRNDQLRRELAQLAADDSFLGDLADAIQFVAEQLGFAMVLRKDVSFLFYLPEMDVTDAVIARLALRAGR